MLTRQALSIAICLSLSAGSAAAGLREVRAEQKAQLDALAATLEPPAAPPRLMVVEDLRPAEEKRVHIMSRFLFNCENGVWNLGDKALAPDRIARLERALATEFGDRLGGRTLSVRKYAIYMNARIPLEQGNIRALGGGIAPALMQLATHVPDENAPEASIAAKCGQDSMSGGWFDTSEISNNFSPLVVEMDVAIQGEDYSVRAVYSPPLELWVAFNLDHPGPGVEALAQRVSDKANQALLAEIAQRHGRDGL